MAEFVEVMKQALRLCGCHLTINKDYCEGCLLATEYGGCMFDLLEKVDPEIIERRVVDWAAEHPEPVYPSWAEGWKQLFPDAAHTPCPEIYFGFKCDKDNEKYCFACKHYAPMPAKIAEKLGIKPKEASK